ncbi:MAG TPA: Gfo/Idh/MocA family oxidoreductase [Lapillicoccus sp.]|nr:Gfo/Idh/MocA family oxidoreductase [Lapillicoccus sp.]
MDAPPLRWGILGTGWIARRFTGALRTHTRQEVYAVGSRSHASARSFAADVGVPEARAYGSYEDLVRDADLDVVYVATPHHLHIDHALLSIEAGRNTFVEKPIGLDGEEVARMEVAADEAGVFLREALWSAYLPKFDVIRQLLDDEVLGRVHSVQADLGEYFPAGHRIMRADLYGGPRYDLLTYPTWFARWVLGPPHVVHEVATVAPPELSPSGVEGQIAVVQRHAEDTVASLFVSVLGDTPSTATIVGSTATLRIDGPFYQPGGFSLRSHDGRELRYDEPPVAHEALHYEAAAVARDLAASPHERTTHA